jgi:hypothetical protein
MDTMRMFTIRSTEVPGMERNVEKKIQIQKFKKSNDSKKEI